MSNNRSLISMNWQEASNGVWYADTTNYRCVAVSKDPESLFKSSPEYTWDSIVYKWSDTENSWIQVEKGIMGSRGMQEAQLSAERLLGVVIERGERKADPGKNMFDQLNRIVENAQMVAMNQQRMQEDPRMRGLPPGHPPIRRRGDRDEMMTFGRSMERKLEMELFTLPNPLSFTSPTLSDIGPVGKSMKEMEADLKKHLDDKFPNRNKGE